MKIKIMVLIATFLFMAPSHSTESNSLDSEKIVAALQKAKVVGMCGALKQMAAFQEATQMPGGNDFVLRFFKTESARLGYELQPFMENCRKIIAEFVELINSLSDTE